MRSLLLVVLGFLPLCSLACATTPAITVVRTSPGDKVEDVRGDNVKLKRGQQEGFAGSKGGYRVVRNQEDWERAWPSDKAPPLPSTLDTSKQMLILGVAKPKDVTRVKLLRAAETAEMLYVWAQETKNGEGCVNRATERAFDVVTTARVDKPVRFFVESERGESCGAPPAAGVECRRGNQPDWTTKISAQPGDSVECALTASAQGKFELIDKGLSMSELPPGSSAKLIFRKGPERGEIEVDVYGKYTVMAEAADEGGRHGSATATIEVVPPKTTDVLVQLAWTNFDVKDVSDSFPRVNLRVAEEGAKGRRCSAEIPVPGLCEVKTRGAYTYMKIPAGSRKLPISIQYQEERVEKGPAPCIHVWYDGQRTAELCDRKHRNDGEIWKAGVLDTATGKIAE